MGRSMEFKRWLTRVARRNYYRGIRFLRNYLTEQQMQHFVLLCDRLKYRWFPELYPSISSAALGALHNPAKVPDWIIDEMRALAHIEPAIYPTPEVLAKFHTWSSPEDTYAAHLYQDMLDDFVTFEPDIIFLAPHMMRGGSDLGTLHHVQLCVARGLRVTVVLTRDVVSPWSHRFPQQVRVVEFGQLSRQASDDDRRLVLLRLLLQSPATTLHLINSHLGWQLFESFGKPLRSSGKRLFASLYCDDLDRYGVRCGYATEFLPKVWKHLDGVISDNTAFIDALRWRDGMPSELMHTVYFPVCIEVRRTSTVGRKVLWASRLVSQKRPSLLLEIARRMPDVQFEVYGESDADDCGVVERLGQLPNVCLHGRYDDFSKIAADDDYALFLYTSAYDGLPNVLLEATASGLPVVAAVVGGIGELIDSSRGFPLEPEAGALAFVEVIRHVLTNPDEASEKVKHAQALLVARHGYQAFLQQMEQLPGYWPCPRRE